MKTRKGSGIEYRGQVILIYKKAVIRTNTHWVFMCFSQKFYKVRISIIPSILEDETEAERLNSWPHS